MSGHFIDPDNHEIKNKQDAIEKISEQAKMIQQFLESVDPSSGVLPEGVDKGNHAFAKKIDREHAAGKVGYLLFCGEEHDDEGMAVSMVGGGGSETYQALFYRLFETPEIKEIAVKVLALMNSMEDNLKPDVLKAVLKIQNDTTLEVGEKALIIKGLLNGSIEP